jgi:hypothetical protein
MRSRLHEPFPEVRRVFVRPTVAALALGAVLAVSGCATQPTTLDARWVAPQAAGQRAVRSVLVVSSVRDATIRRMFEDRMVAALTASGVQAAASYRFVPDDGPVSEAQLRRAVADAGAGHALVSRIANVSTEVNVIPGMVVGPAWGPGLGWPGGWGPGWGGFAGYHNAMWATTVPPRVTSTQYVHADTRVFEAATAAVVWSAATTTAPGRDPIAPLVDQFVELIVAAMKQDGMF